jgi:hypothetical protein
MWCSMPRRRGTSWAIAWPGWASRSTSNRRCLRSESPLSAAEIQAVKIEGPMATVIFGGLATSTLLNLLVLPTLALRYGRFEARQES